MTTPWPTRMATRMAALITTPLLLLLPPSRALAPTSQGHAAPMLPRPPELWLSHASLMLVARLWWQIGIPLLIFIAAWGVSQPMGWCDKELFERCSKMFKKQFTPRATAKAKEMERVLAKHAKTQRRMNALFKRDSDIYVAFRLQLVCKFFVCGLVFSSALSAPGNLPLVSSAVTISTNAAPISLTFVWSA